MNDRAMHIFRKLIGTHAIHELHLPCRIGHNATSHELTLSSTNLHHVSPMEIAFARDHASSQQTTSPAHGRRRTLIHDESACIVGRIPHPEFLGCHTLRTRRKNSSH